MLSIRDTKKLLDSSYDSNETIQNKPLAGYKLDTELSTKNHKVFLNENNKPFIVYRGTSNRMDVGTDVKKWLGFNSHRDDISKKVNQSVINKYDQTPTLLGHSLGAGLAQDSAMKNQKVITYNKLSKPSDVFLKKNKNQTNYRTFNDPISRFTVPSDKNVNFRSRSLNPFVAHSTKGLKEENRMSPWITLL